MSVIPIHIQIVKKEGDINIDTNSTELFRLDLLKFRSSSKIISFSSIPYSIINCSIFLKNSSLNNDYSFFRQVYSIVKRDNIILQLKVKLNIISTFSDNLATIVVDYSFLKKNKTKRNDNITTP